jgi:hypothetical protein
MVQQREKHMTYRVRAVLLLSPFLLAQILLARVPQALSAELRPETVEGFQRYVWATEARVRKQVARPDGFLYIDGLSQPRRSEVQQLMKQGKIFIERLESRDASGNVIGAPGGLIHHWIGDVFIPGASISQVLNLVEDYAHHQDVYQPDVVRSQLLSHNDDDFKVFLRFREKKVVTVTMDTVHEVHYSRLDSAHWYSQSVATRIAEVENPDKPNEREKPPGHDSGFLWRLNSYWRFAELDGGVYVETESISLTRDLPTGLGWLVGPFVTSVPRESLERTLGSTRSAVLARIETNRRKAAGSPLKDPKNASSARMQKATLAPLGAGEPRRRTPFSRPESGG